MKYIAIVTCAAALLCCFNSCKKNSVEREHTDSNSIKGTWELESVTANSPFKEYPSGNGNIFEFADTTYKKYTNGNLSKSGYYTLVPDASVTASVGLVITSGQFTHRIIFDRDTAAQKIFADLLNNKLRLVTGYFPLDGGSLSVYKRK